MKIDIIHYDFKIIRKDPMLLMSIIAPFLIWMLMFYGFPFIQEISINHWNYDIQSHFFQALVFFIPLIPFMFGMVYGFMLLDERDAGIITAISVTPFGKTGYLLLRMFFPYFISFFSIILFSIFLNILSIINLWQLIIASMVLSLNVPIMVLFLGAFAGNKVEGMAISKGFGFLLIAIVLDYIVPSPYNWLAVYSPIVWIEKAIFSSSNTIFLSYAFAGLITHLLLLFVLYKKFKSRNN